MGRKMTSNKRAYGVGGLTRYKNPPVTDPTPRREAELRADHRAVIDGHTIFPTSVYDAGDRDRILIPGINNSKIGGRVTKGRWAGFPIFTFALEERATCPRSCGLWRACYGNALPVAVRFRFNNGFLMSLEEELVAMGDHHPGGFAVRAHVLGDFVDLDYVRHWRLWMELVPELHVWGYTARPTDGAIGKEIVAMNARRPDRWQVRFSVAEDAPYAPMQVTTTWTKPNRYAFDPETKSMICPQEIGKTDHCTTCGICWNPRLQHVRVRFLGHGNVNGNRGQSPKTDAKYADPIPTARNTLPPLPSERFDSVEAFIAARGVTRLPPAKARGL
jgi:hypothetical protein